MQLDSYQITNGKELKQFLNVYGNAKDPNSQTVVSCPVLTVAS